jgi:hypothetical protein
MAVPSFLAFPGYVLSDSPEARFTAQQPRQPAHIRALAYAVCLGVIAIGLMHLYAPLLGRHGYWGQERAWPYLRTLEYIGEFRAGHFPPLSFTDAISGGGYAFPLFYPPAAYLISSFFTWGLGDVVLGVHMAFFLSVVLSGLAMYFMLERFTRNKLIALIGAVAYVTFPYRFTNVFERAALAESWTFVWYPLLLAGGWEIVKGRLVPWYLPVSLAGALLTHNITLVYFLCICAVLVWAGRRDLKWRGIVRVVLAGAVGGGLALWFLLPQQYYVGEVQAADREFIWATPESASHYRLRAEDLISDELRPDGVRLGMGIAEILLVPLALLARRRSKSQISDLDPRLYRCAFLLLIVWCVFLVVMLFPGITLRLLPKIFAYIQFPWRLTGINGFLACTAGALFLAASRPSLHALRLLAIASGLMMFAIPEYRRTAHVRQDWTARMLETQIHGTGADSGYTVLGEYLPRGLPLEKAKRSVRSAPSVSHDVRVVAWSKRGSEITTTLKASRPGRITFPLVYYDFYRVVDQDGNVSRSYARDGLLTADVPAGVHILRVERRMTPVAILGSTLTLASAFGLIGMVRSRRRAEAELSDGHESGERPKGVRDGTNAVAVAS